MTARLDGADAAPRVELIGALLLGLGVMRSVVGAPAVSGVTFEQTRVLVADMVRAVSGGRPR